MAQLLYPECNCPQCSAPRSKNMLISIRVKATKTILREKDICGFMGPTWITKWIMRQAAACGEQPGDYEYRIGKKGAWQS